jgi:hypothetical protein
MFGFWLRSAFDTCSQRKDSPSPRLCQVLVMFGFNSVPRFDNVHLFRMTRCVITCYIFCVYTDTFKVGAVKTICINGKIK